MGSLANLVRVTSATTGTGTITLGSAVSGFLTPANAGIVTGQVVTYAIEADYVAVGDDMVPTSREVGWGVYTASGLTLTRNVVNSTNSNALLNLAGDQQVIICPTTETFEALAAENIIINGAMDVSQEFGATAQTSKTSGYIVDQFHFDAVGAAVATLQQVADAPPGFEHSLKVSITTADAAIAAGDYVQVYTAIEGYRVDRLGFGAAGAQSLGFSFWVKAHRTGTYSGAINGATSTRSYPFEYTVNVADTWEYKTVVIPGDTTGTYDAANGVAFYIIWVMAVGSTFAGTANAWAAADRKGTTNQVNGVAATTDTFQLSGVSLLESGVPVAQELSALCARLFMEEWDLCQRYYGKSYDYTIALGSASTNGAVGVVLSNFASSTYTFGNMVWYKTRMRAAPTMTIYASVSGTINKIRDINANNDINPTVVSIGEMSTLVIGTMSTAGTGINLGSHWVADARQ